MADVAQLVEQSIRNRQVIGSSPDRRLHFFVAALQTAWDFRLPEILFAPVAHRSARGLHLGPWRLPIVHVS